MAGLATRGRAAQGEEKWECGGARSQRDCARPAQRRTLEVRPPRTLGPRFPVLPSWRQKVRTGLLSMLLDEGVSHPERRELAGFSFPGSCLFLLCCTAEGLCPMPWCKLLGSTKFTLSCSGVLRRLHKKVVSSSALATTVSLSVQNAWHILGSALGLSLRL